MLFGVRVALHRWRRTIAWWRHPQHWATEYGNPALYAQVLAERTSPLQRAPDGAIAAYTDEKVQNLRLACRKVDGLVLAPDTIFSFCRTIGKTTRQQGYLPALELHDGALHPSVGGGLCQLSNLLLLLAVDINAEIVERHRHSYDLFRDVERTVPFGCGATVFYNYVDFQFRHRQAFPVCLHAVVEPPVLRVQVLANSSLPCQTTLVETDHRFFRAEGQVYRTNRIWRDITWHDQRPSERELLFSNTCRVLYNADDLVTEEAHV